MSSRGVVSHIGSAAFAPARRWQTFRAAWAAALAGLLGLLFTGLTAATIVLWATDPAYDQTNPVVDVAFFALGGILVTVGFASQVRSPRIAGLQQAIVALGVLALAGWLGGRVEPFVGPLALLGAAAPLVILHPDRRRLLAAGAGVSKRLAALAAVAAVPAVIHAVRMLEHARAARPSCFFGQCVTGDRYAETAALAVAVVGVSLLAAARTPGWKVPAWSAGVAAVVFGVASLAFPRHVGAPSSAWAAVAVLWGGGLVGVAYLEGRPIASGREERGR